MTPTQAPQRAPSRRHLAILGSILGLLSLLWLVYPSKNRDLHVLHQAQTPRICSEQETTIRNVAVIGAGSAGASAAYYLNNFQSSCNRLNVTIYERNDYVGGRSTTVNAYHDPTQPVELGASIFVKVNHNLVNAAEEFALPINSMRSAGKIDKAEVLGVWDGQQFVFTQSDNTNSYWNLAKLFWKYGLSPLRTQNLMKKTVGSFLKMYEAPYFPFSSLSRLASDLDLISATAATGKQYLEANSVGEKFAHDIIQASTRVNYAQNLDQIHGLEAMVCMAADGAMFIEGGNWQIFDGMIKASGATLLLNTNVTSIATDPKTNTYALKSTTPILDPAQDLPTEDAESIYDTIILATPLQFSSIQFLPPLSSPPPEIPYVSLHVTLFTSPYPLYHTTFDVPEDAEMPTTILTTTPPPDTSTTSPPFYSISTLRKVRVPESFNTGSECKTSRKEYLYKTFSPSPLSDEYIHSLLDIPPQHTPRHQQTHCPQKLITWKYEKRWDSYPYLPPRVTFEDLRLDSGEGGGGIWYTSGIESFISTMETSSLMGMNVAKLVVDGWEMEEEEGRGAAQMKEKVGGEGVVDGDEVVEELR